MIAGYSSEKLTLNLSIPYLQVLPILNTIQEHTTTFIESNGMPAVSKYSKGRYNTFLECVKARIVKHMHRAYLAATALDPFFSVKVSKLDIFLCPPLLPHPHRCSPCPIPSDCMIMQPPFPPSPFFSMKVDGKLYAAVVSLEP